MQLPKTCEEFKKIYMLKEQLVAICRSYGLPHTGSKEDLTNYICAYIQGQPIEKKRQHTKQVTRQFVISPDIVISEDYANDEHHRQFFLQEIGHHFKFNVQFMNWMKAHKGKRTYQDAIEEWKRIYDEKRRGVKYDIGKQFEYNQYTRDFFADNPGRSKAECLICWNYKKSIPGNHHYEPTDLAILQD